MQQQDAAPDRTPDWTGLYSVRPLDGGAEPQAGAPTWSELTRVRQAFERHPGFPQHGADELARLVEHRGIGYVSLALGMPAAQVRATCATPTPDRVDRLRGTLAERCAKAIDVTDEAYRPLGVARPENPHGTPSTGFANLDRVLNRMDAVDDKLLELHGHRPDPITRRQYTAEELEEMAGWSPERRQAEREAIAGVARKGLGLGIFGPEQDRFERDRSRRLSRGLEL